MLRSILTVVTASFLLNSLAIAQKTDKEDTPPDYLKGISGVSKIDEASKKHAQSVSDEIKKAFDSTYSQTQDKIKSDSVKDLTRQFDAIADQTLSKDRDKILESMGIPKSANTSLYYFVSFSMPMPLLRSYVLDALWSGGTLIFRGSTPGKKLNEFVVEDLRSLVYGKGASAAISIDPRLYDILQVNAVPTIAFVEDKSILDCFDPIQVSFKDEDMQEATTVDTCRPASTGFFKVSGAVSGKYALELFEEHGAKGIEPYKNALMSGYKSGQLSNTDKSQSNFKGKWEDVLTPEAKAAIDSAIPTPK